MQILTLKVTDKVAEAYNSASIEQKKEMNNLIETLFSKGEQKKQLDRQKEDSYYDVDFSIKPCFKNETKLKVKALKIDSSLPKVLLD
jgi:nitrogen-specific signal transduction histidine kinase